MYSRSHIPKEPYHIPENYRGNAFHSGSSTPDTPISPLPSEEISPQEALPTQEQKGEFSVSKDTEEFGTVAPTPSKKETPTFLSSLLPPKPKGLGNGGLLSDIGAEELLILGILLLLSQNNSDDDILLLLLLLLFYK